MVLLVLLYDLVYLSLVALETIHWFGPMNDLRSTRVEVAGEEQRSSAGKGSTLAGHPGHRDFYSLPVKSLSTGRCGANAASFHLEAKHREVLGRKMAEWALPGTRKGQLSVSCRVVTVSASKNQKAKKTVAVSRGERGQMYFSLCVFHLACTRFLSLALLFVGFLPHVVGISEYKKWAQKLPEA